MRRVLVTGASGLIGRHALLALRKRGFEVHAVARRPQRAVETGLVWHAADLLHPGVAADLATAVGAEALLHLAWCTEHGEYWNSPANLEWRRASLKLVEAFSAAGGRRAVVAGSCAEYDWGLGHERLSEALTPLTPSTPYGAAKDELRQELETMSAEAGLSLAWGRAFFTFGEGEDPRRLVPAVARALLAGKPACTSHGRHLRDLLASEDVGDAFAALLDGTVEGAVNLGSGNGLALHVLTELVAEAVGRPDLLRVGALEARPGEPERLVADPRRLSYEVGWEPRIPLPDAVCRTVAWWRERLS